MNSWLRRFRASFSVLTTAVFSVGRRIVKVVQLLRSPFPPNREKNTERVYQQNRYTAAIKQYCVDNGHGYVCATTIPLQMQQQVLSTATTLVLDFSSIRSLLKLLQRSSFQRLWIVNPTRLQSAQILVIWCAARIAKKIGPLNRINLDETHSILEIVRNRSRPVPHTRWHIERSQLLEFFAALHAANVQYVLLRWWQYVYDLPEAEDLDILIEDNDYDTVAMIASKFYGDGKMDVYSASGLPSADWNGMPYYPANLAHRMLRNRILWENSCYVPCVRDYFYSLAYHAVLRKGTLSGLPKSRSQEPAITKADHNYFRELSLAASRSQVETPFTLDDLFRMLAKDDWLPQLDTLRKLAGRNEWLATKVRPNIFPENEGDLVVFVLREAAIEDGVDQRAKELIEYHGFHIVHEVQLEGESQSRAGELMRGGCWHRGPYPRSGGPPSRAWIAYDYCPRPVLTEDASSPFVVNSNVFKKRTFRKKLEKLLPPDRRCNVLHTSDDQLEAIEYIYAVCPTEIDNIRHVKRALDAFYYSDRWPVDRVLGGWGDRAKVELVTNGQTRAVKKTFREGRERFFDREKDFFDVFTDCAWLPELLDVGPNYIVCRHVANRLDSMTEEAKLNAIRSSRAQIVKIIRDVYERGIALIDFNPRNLLLNSDGRVMVCDFEFAHRYNRAPTSVLESYDVVGPPVDFSGDLPGQDRVHACWYSKTWQPIFREPIASVFSQ